MELGSVFLENGDISYEKLFYFHYRTIPNQLFFIDIDGSGLAKFIAEKYIDNIKEQKDSICYDIKKKIDILDEKTIIFNSQEIIIGNGYRLVYYYGDKRTLEDAILRKLAVEYSYNSNYNDGL